MWRDKAFNRMFSWLSVLFLATNAFAIDHGAGQVTAVGGDTPLTVFTYSPPNCDRPALLFVFHGTNRNAREYRDKAKPLADRLCLVVFAPLFDHQHFPRWRYHRGGIIHKGRSLPRSEWTIALVEDLVQWARKRVGRPTAPYYLFGHSAGAQFLSRVAALAPPLDAARIVIANSSSYVAPSVDESAPYGFGGLFAEAEAQKLVKHYLGLPITIYLGEADTGRRHLHNHPAARRQGKNRFDRGRNVYRAAMALAGQKGWTCNWRLVTVPRVGHSSRKMLAAPEALQAFASAH